MRWPRILSFPLHPLPLLSLQDLDARKGAIPVLAALARDGALVMGTFEKAAGVSSIPARKLREALEALGLVESRRVAPRSGSLEAIEVSLTAAGREVARHLAAADDALRALKGPEDLREQARAREEAEFREAQERLKRGSEPP